MARFAPCFRAEPLLVAALGGFLVLFAGCSGTANEAPAAGGERANKGAWLSDVVQLTAFDAHSCARDRRGAVYCWGAPTGCGGAAYPCDRRQPLRIDVPTAIDLSANWLDCALTRAGQVWCWGATVPEFGKPQSKLVEPRLLMTVPGATQVSANSHGACVRAAEGRVMCSRVRDAGSPPRQALGPTEGVTAFMSGLVCGPRDGELACWEPHGGKPWRMLFRGNGGPESRALEGTGPTDVPASYNPITCYLKESGAVWCAGNNAVGALADGTTRLRKGFHQVESLGGIRQLALAEAHPCALGAEGQVWCWGRDPVVGAGMKRAVLTRPTQVVGLPASAAIVAGQRHHCALHRDGTVSCWGACGAGQCGNSTARKANQPLRVEAAASPSSG